MRFPRAFPALRIAHRPLNYSTSGTGARSRASPQNTKHTTRKPPLSRRKTKQKHDHSIRINNSIIACFADLVPSKTATRKEKEAFYRVRRMSGSQDQIVAAKRVKNEVEKRQAGQLSLVNVATLLNRCAKHNLPFLGEDGWGQYLKVRDQNIIVERIPDLALTLPQALP